MTADYKDRVDFENADRNFIGNPDPMVITAADGRGLGHELGLPRRGLP